MKRETIWERLEYFRCIDSKTDCWLFLGQKTGGGYGNIWFNGYTYLVHRVSAHLYLELDIDDENSLALHKDICPNRHCFNPDHLYLGTHKDNIRDSVREGTHRNSTKAVCHKGHPFDKITIRRSGKVVKVCGTCAKERDKNRLRRKK